MCQGPSDRTQVWYVTWETHRTQHIVVRRVICATATGGKAKSAKGKLGWGKVWGKPAAGFRGSSPNRVTLDALNSSVPIPSVNMCEMCHPGHLSRDTMPRVCLGDWSSRHLLPSMQQKSWLPAGKQVFTINHSVWSNGLGTVSPSYH